MRSNSSPVPSPLSGPQLAPEKVQEMNRKLTKEMERFERVMKEIPENLTAVDRDEEIQKIKRGHATRKSMIRKAYGIQVRKSKLRPANAVTTPQGELDMSAISSRSATPGSASIPSFAPINRLEAFRATGPSPLASQVLPPIQGRPGPLLEGSDNKRRRYDDPSDVSTFRVVDYVPKPPKSSSSGPEKERTPLPMAISVDPAIAARALDLIDRNKQKDSPVEGSRPSSANSNSAVSATTFDTRPTQKVPIAAAQKQWEAQDAVRPTSSERASAERPSIETPSVEVPSVEAPLAVTPSVVTPSVATPTVETPPVDTPPLDTPTSPVSSTSTESAGIEAKKETISTNTIPAPRDVDSESDGDIPAKKLSPSKTQSQSTSRNAALAVKVTRSETTGRTRKASMRSAQAPPVKITRAMARA